MNYKKQKETKGKRKKEEEIRRSKGEQEEISQEEPFVIWLKWCIICSDN